MYVFPLGFQSYTRQCFLTFSILYYGNTAVMAEGGRKVEDPRTAPVTTSAESKGGQKDADTSYPPEIVMELKRDFIFPVKDAQAQLLKECKVCKGSLL